MFDSSGLLVWRVRVAVKGFEGRGSSLATMNTPPNMSEYTVACAVVVVGVVGEGVGVVWRCGG